MTTAFLCVAFGSWLMGEELGTLAGRSGLRRAAPVRLIDPCTRVSAHPRQGSRWLLPRHERVLRVGRHHD